MTSPELKPPSERQLPRPPRLGPAATMEVDVDNFVLITHDVPAARVRPHVPPAFALETFAGDDGHETALITTSCFFNRQVHWSPLRRPAVDFLQNTFRTYVTFQGLRGSYFFSTYVSVHFVLHPPRPLFDVESA